MKVAALVNQQKEVIDSLLNELNRCEEDCGEEGGDSNEIEEGLGKEGALDALSEMSSLKTSLATAKSEYRAAYSEMVACKKQVYYLIFRQ